MSLSDELKKSPPPRQRGQGRQAFIARRNEIEQALDDGYSSAEIWQHLHDKGVMPIQYRQFVRYVDRYITSKQANEQPPVSSGPNNPPTVEREKKENREAPKQLKNKDDLTRRFQYDAKGKSEEDLI